MDLSSTPLFTLADQRLAWVDARQSLLAENIANADTPHWQALDVKPFAATLQQATLKLAVTNAADIQPTGPGGVPGGNAVVAEQSPDGNSVAIDKQLVKVADTDAAHELVMTVTKKYLGLVRTALDK